MSVSIRHLISSSGQQKTTNNANDTIQAAQIWASCILIRFIRQIRGCAFAVFFVASRLGGYSRLRLLLKNLRAVQRI